MTRAVHWLQCKLLLFNVKRKHVLSVMLPMSRCYPQFGIVNIWSNYFLKSSNSVFTSNKFYQCIIYVCTFGLEKARTRRQFVEKEEFLLFANLTMIPFRCFFLKFFPFFHSFRVWE
uniref:Uncharacterized protein n=1 Tax=Panstrongylus lignarius TaxID=156445 RepID=A0A224XTN6_9HEMI